MNIHFAPENNNERRVNIKVVGVGGAGGNAVNRMIEAGLSEVDFYAVNTDGQALDTSRAHQTLVIGSELTRGLGAGGDPTVGRAAAEADRELLATMVEDADMVFVTAGMGGGTGTGAAPIVAEVARKSGALTVAVVTRPFMFEGARREAQAESGLAALREQVDALLVIPNERLMEIDLADGGMTEVFRVADNVLYEATRGISDIIAQHAVVNLDFADVRTVMQDSGAAIMGTGRASGEQRADRAAEQAVNSPLLEDVDIHGSRAVLVYITAAAVDRDDLRGAMGHIQKAAGEGAHIFFGFTNDESLGEDIQVTVIATGFPAGQVRPEAPVVEAVAAEPVAAEPVVAEPVVTETVVAEPAVAEPIAPETLTMESAVVEPDPPTSVEVAAEAVVPDVEPVAPVVEPVAPVVEPVAPVVESVTPIDEPMRAMDAEPTLATEPTLAAEPTPEPRQEPIAVEAEETTSGAALAALAAAAGGRGRTVAAPEAEPSETSRRFLDPLGAVKLGGGDQPSEPTQSSQRFRSSVLGDDKLRPAWERKYVD